MYWKEQIKTYTKNYKRATVKYKRTIKKQIKWNDKILKDYFFKRKILLKKD